MAEFRLTPTEERIHAIEQRAEALGYKLVCFIADIPDLQNRYYFSALDSHNRAVILYARDDKESEGVVSVSVFTYHSNFDTAV